MVCCGCGLALHPGSSLFKVTGYSFNFAYAQ